MAEAAVRGVLLTIYLLQLLHVIMPTPRRGFSFSGSSFTVGTATASPHSVISYAGGGAPSARAAASSASLPSSSPIARTETPSRSEDMSPVRMEPTFSFSLDARWDRPRPALGRPRSPRVFRFVSSRSSPALPPTLPPRIVLTSLNTWQSLVPRRVEVWSYSATHFHVN